MRPETNGAGVIVAEERVLAAAHVVIGSGRLTVSTPDGVSKGTLPSSDLDADF